MTDKLSRETLKDEIINVLDSAIYIAKQEDPLRIKTLKQAKEQIKSLLTPVPEEKRNMLIEQWASEFSIDSRLDYLTAKELLNKAFKAYDNLREGKEG